MYLSKLFLGSQQSRHISLKPIQYFFVVFLILNSQYRIVEVFYFLMLHYFFDYHFLLVQLTRSYYHQDLIVFRILYVFWCFFKIILVISILLHFLNHFTNSFIVIPIFFFLFIYCNAILAFLNQSVFLSCYYWQSILLSLSFQSIPDTQG